MQGDATGPAGPRAGIQDSAALGDAERRGLCRGAEGHQAGGAVVDDGVRQVFQRADREVPGVGERCDERNVKAC